MEHCQWRCITDRRRQAVSCTCRSHWKARSPSGERLVDGTTSMAESAECRRCRVSTLDVQSRLAGCQQGTPALFHEDSGRPQQTVGMWLALELSTNAVLEAMGLCVLTASLRKPNGCGIQDGLHPVLQVAGKTSENRVAVVHLADNQCTNQGQQGMSWQRSPHAPDLEPRSTLWRRLWRASSWTCQHQCRPRGRGSKKLAARQWCQCGPDQTRSDVDEMCTRELQSWRDSATADWMPSKPKPHRHRQTLSRSGRQNLRVSKPIDLCVVSVGMRNQLVALHQLQQVSSV